MIIILGVAGSGKSTQGGMLSSLSNFKWLSIGELLRSRIDDDRRDQMLAGKMLNDIEVIEILYDELKSLGDNPEILLDGFPRTVFQADWLMEKVLNGELKINHVINLNVNKVVAKSRLLGRGRQDDHESAIAERFNEYDSTILPIIKDFKKHDIDVIEVNAEYHADVVYNDIKNKLFPEGEK